MNIIIITIINNTLFPFDVNVYVVLWYSEYSKNKVYNFHELSRFFSFCPFVNIGRINYVKGRI